MQSKLNPNGQESDDVPVKINQRNGFFCGPMQGPRIDDTHVTLALVRWNMAVSDENVIEMRISVGRLSKNFDIVTMCDRDFLSREFQSREIIAALNPKPERVTLERRSIEIVVAPDENARDAGQEIEDLFTAHIAAVDEKLRAAARSVAIPAAAAAILS